MHWISPSSPLCACVRVCVYVGLCIHPCVHMNALVYICARSILIWAFRHVFVYSITLKMAGACVWVDVNVREWAFACTILRVRLCESYILIWFSKASLSMFTLTSLWWVFPSGQGKKKKKSTPHGYVPKLMEISSRLESPPSQHLKQHHPDGWQRAGKITSLPSGYNGWQIPKFIKRLQYFTSHAEVQNSMNPWTIHSRNSPKRLSHHQ